MADNVFIYEMDKPRSHPGSPHDHVRTVPWAAKQDVEATGTSQQSAAFGTSTTAVTVQADVDIRVEFGADPTAVANSFKIFANTERDFGVVPGQKMAFKTA